MEILTEHRLKNIGLVALSIMCYMIWDDSRAIKKELRTMESAYERFLSKKSDGKELRNYVRRDTLSVFPISSTEGVVCAIIPVAELKHPPTP